MRPNRFVRALARSLAFSRRQHGVVAAEFALITPFLLLLLSGAIDLGLALNQSSSLSNAARAGAQFAVRYPSDQAGIEKVVANALPYDPALLTINSVLACECADGAGVSCTDSCAGAAPKTYVTVTVSMPFSSPLPTHMAIGLTTLSGSAVFRAN